MPRHETSKGGIPWDLPRTDQGVKHHPIVKLVTETYTFQRACSTSRLWLLDAITVGLFGLVVIGMTEGRRKPSDLKVGITMCTHFLDLAIAALLSLLSSLVCLCLTEPVQRA